MGIVAINTNGTAYQVTLTTYALILVTFVICGLVCFFGTVYTGYQAALTMAISPSVDVDFWQYTQAQWRTHVFASVAQASAIYVAGYVMFYLLVQRHLISIARFMQKNTLTGESELLDLQQGTLAIVPDEFVYLQSNINKMLETIGTNYENLTSYADEIKFSELEHQRILDNLQDTYYRVDTSGLFMHISASGEQLLGYRFEELIGQVYMVDLYENPADRELFLEELAAGNGRIAQFNTKLVHKDGSLIYVATSARTINDENGQAIGVEGITRDITEQRFASERLFKEKELAQVTLKSIADAVITTDESGYVTFMNPVAEKLTDCSNESDIGRSISELFHIVEEQDGKYINRVTCSSYEEAEEIIKLVPGNFIIASASEIDDYLYLQNDDSEFDI